MSFLSEENMRGLYHDGANFISGLPSSRIIYGELIENKAKELEKVGKVTVYGKMALFIKTTQIKPCSSRSREIGKEDKEINNRCPYRETD